MRFPPRSLAVLALVSFAAPPFAFAADHPPPTLRIDAGRPGAAVSPLFYGLMTEEINHSYEGGLYAELIRNRSLGEDDRDAHAPSTWLPVSTGQAQVSLSIDPAMPLNSEMTRSLRLDVKSVASGDRAGVSNGGFWGIAVRAGERYRASFMAKAAAGFNGPLTVSLESADGSRVYASGRVKRVTTYWKNYEVDLRPEENAPDANNRFVVTMGSPGTVWFQMVSLFPPTYHNRPNGNRLDLMEKLAYLQPAFLRFPGGNYLEGDDFNERFDWKKTIGGVAFRPGHRSPWKYWSTDGLGLLEYLEWCEDLHMQPVLAVFAGYALKHDHVDAGPALQPYVQDALDEIEYVTGGTDTKWGGRRAEDGHRAPFALTYVEIGNEDWFDRSKSYDGRFAQFYDAIKAKHPSLQIIATTPVKSRRPDVLDEHFYKTAAYFYSQVHRYDTYDRNGPKIFVGEWATREGRPAPTPNLKDALGDFAWMTGMERNSDLVIMNCYAPLLVNVSPGAMQWQIDLIGYDAMRSYGSPSYYAQAMFNRNKGERVLPAELSGGVDGVYYSVTGTGGLFGHVYVKVANTNGEPVTLQLAIDGRKTTGKGTETVLSSASLTDTNSIADPEKIMPRTRALEGAGAVFNHTFPAYSDTVLVIDTR